MRELIAVQVLVLVLMRAGSNSSGQRIQLALEILAAGGLYGWGCSGPIAPIVPFTAEVAGLTRVAPPEPPPQAVIAVEYQNEQ